MHPSPQPNILHSTPLPTLVSPKTPSWTGLPCKGQVVSAVCCWGWGAWTKGAFIAVGSGCLRTDNGLILLILKLIAVCSLPFQGEKRGQWEQETEASVVGMKGKIPRGTYE